MQAKNQSKIKITIASNYMEVLCTPNLPLETHKNHGTGLLISSFTVQLVCMFLQCH